MIAPRLKTASMILFWFGILFQFFAIVRFAFDYNKETLFGMNPSFVNSLGVIGIVWIIYLLFAHVTHIVSGLLISRGKSSGIVIGLILGFYEIVGFLIPSPDPVLFTPHGIGIRILFAFVIFLIISGRKELPILQSANWRPWKNPKTTQFIPWYWKHFLNVHYNQN